MGASQKTLLPNTPRPYTESQKGGEVTEGLLPGYSPMGNSERLAQAKETIELLRDPLCLCFVLPP